MQKTALLLFLFLLAFHSYSQSKNFLDKPYLETTATVDTLVVPDRIYLSILITEKDTKGKISVEELENRMNTKLLALGIDTKKQLALTDVASNFKKYFLKGTDVLKNKAYSLLVYDAKTAGNVIVGLEAIEISNVHLEKTEYSKIDQLELALKQQAVVKAKKHAEAILQPINQVLGKAIFISDLNSNFSNMLMGKAAGINIRGLALENDAAQNNPIDIEFEKIKLEVTIRINFAIE